MERVGGRPWEEGGRSLMPLFLQDFLSAGISIVQPFPNGIPCSHYILGTECDVFVYYIFIIVI